jgi:hypothetical protein
MRCIGLNYSIKNKIIQRLQMIITFHKNNNNLKTTLRVAGRVPGIIQVSYRCGRINRTICVAVHFNNFLNHSYQQHHIQTLM